MMVPISSINIGPNNEDLLPMTNGQKLVKLTGSGGDVSNLLEKVTLLETKLTCEEREKIHLAEEVAALREENLRLQEESQTAAQQLKKFTDWFFQAIDNA
jgi:signal-induced proliferation-associated 1 like protein 1